MKQFFDTALKYMHVTQRPLLFVGAQSLYEIDRFYIHAYLESGDERELILCTTYDLDRPR